MPASVLGVGAAVPLPFVCGASHKALVEAELQTNDYWGGVSGVV